MKDLVDMIHNEYIFQTLKKEVNKGKKQRK